MAEADRGRGTTRPGGRQRGAGAGDPRRLESNGLARRTPRCGTASARAAMAGRRLAALAALASVPPGENQTTDFALLKTWNGVSAELTGCVEAEPFHARIRAASARASRLAELKRRIDDANQGRGSEQAIVEASDALIPNYLAAYADRVRHAHEQIASSALLDQALAAQPQSDLAIAAAAERARADWSWTADLATAARCELAIRRRERLRVLDAISASLPLDEQDTQWVATWNHSLLADCHDAREYRGRHAKATARIAAFRELEMTLKRGDAVTVKRLSQKPVLADHPGLLRNKAEIDTLIAKSQPVERLVAAARGGQSQAFLTEAEPDLLIAYAAEFAPYRERIVSWIDERLRRDDILRAADPMFVADAGGKAVTVRWAWMQSRLVRTCLVAADTTRFLKSPEEAR